MPRPWAFFVCAFLLFYNLDKPALWQDEAETALLSCSTLKHGIPQVHDEGMRISGQHSLSAHESNAQGLWIWNTWLPYYLGAGSLGIFGQTTWAARLPFAVFGLLAFLLAQALFKYWAPNRLSAQLATWLLALNAPWLLLMRQCRYYSLISFAVLAATQGYRMILQGHRSGPLVLGASLVGLFHSSFAYGPLALLVLGADALLRKGETPAFYKRFWTVVISVVLLNLPAAWYFRIWARPGIHNYPLSESLDFLKTFMLWLHQFAVASPVLAAYLLWRFQVTKKILWGQPRILRVLFLMAYALALASLSGEGPASHIGTLALYSALAVFALKNPSLPGELGSMRIILFWIIGTLGLFSITGAEPYGRYLAGLIPLTCYAMGHCISELSQRRLIPAAVLCAICLTSNLLYILSTKLCNFLEPAALTESVSGMMRARLRAWPLRSELGLFLNELLRGPKGYVEAVSSELLKRGKSGESAFSISDNLSYGFYTKLRFLSLQELERETPDWILPCPWLQLTPQAERRVQYLIQNHSYETIQVPAPNMLWQNNPDILFHSFRPRQETKTIYHLNK